MTDASGNALSLNSYNEYGLPHATNAAYQGRFGYTGQVYLPEIGLYNYKNRMYAPSLGRFLQPDSIGYGDGLNIYAYVHGDPINATDPWGTVQYLCGFTIMIVSHPGRELPDGTIVVVENSAKIDAVYCSDYDASSKVSGIFGGITRKSSDKLRNNCII